jgi:hypothetical protein
VVREIVLKTDKNLLVTLLNEQLLKNLGPLKLGRPLLQNKKEKPKSTRGRGRPRELTEREYKFLKNYKEPEKIRHDVWELVDSK